MGTSENSTGGQAELPDEVLADLASLVSAIDENAPTAAVPPIPALKPKNNAFATQTGTAAAARSAAIKKVGKASKTREPSTLADSAKTTNSDLEPTGAESAERVEVVGSKPQASGDVQPTDASSDVSFTELADMFEGSTVPLATTVPPDVALPDLLDGVAANDRLPDLPVARRPSWLRHNWPVLLAACFVVFGLVLTVLVLTSN